MANNFCPKCGNKIDKDLKYCEKCEKKEEKEVKEEKQVEVENKKDSGTVLGIVSLLLCFVCTPFCAVISTFLGSSVSFFDDISFLFPGIGFVVTIVGNCIYPKNSLLKAVLWMCIGAIVSFFSMSIWLFFSVTH